MKLNWVEKALINSPIRTWMQRRVADRWFLQGPISLRDRRVLEIGCGRGTGTELLLDRYGAHQVIAFDYDPAHVASARRRLQPAFGGRVVLFVGDAEWLPFASDQFDVIIELAVLHHLSDWRRALGEIARVLEPGGWFFYEEFLRGFVAHPASRALLAHPRSGWFTAEEFTAALHEAGFVIKGTQRQWREWWLAGAARKP